MDKRLFQQACLDGGTVLDSALRALQRDYWRALLHEALSSLGDLEAARDLVHETLIKAWLRCAQFRGDSELFPWLKRILRHALIDRLRSRHLEQPLDDEHGQPLAEVETALRETAGRAAATPEQVMQSNELEAVYRQCQARFAADHPLAASVIRWIAEDDLTHAQISALLDREPGATREFISQCRKKARVYFRDWYLLAVQGNAAPLAGCSRVDAAPLSARPAPPGTGDGERGGDAQGAQA